MQIGSGSVFEIMRLVAGLDQSVHLLDGRWQRGVEKAPMLEGADLIHHDAVAVVVIFVQLQGISREYVFG